MSTKKAAVEAEPMVITPPNFQRMKFRIIGDAPMVQNKFSEKAKGTMKATQEAGSKAKNKRAKAPKDFQELAELAKHVSVDGWYGIPAPAFRNAMVSACRVAGFAMTKAKLSVFVEAEGFSDEGTPLVRITKGEPHYCEHTVRLQGTTTDIRPRSMWDAGWEAEPVIKWDADQFTAKDMAALMARVGMQVGIGEGRPDSKSSCGMGWGTFTLASDE